MDKPWGKGDFWGMSYVYDPQWILNEEQKAIEGKLMEVCRTVIRPNAVSIIYNHQRLMVQDALSISIYWR